MPVRALSVRDLFRSTPAFVSRLIDYGQPRTLAEASEKVGPADPGVEDFTDAQASEPIQVAVLISCQEATPRDVSNHCAKFHVHHHA